MTNAIHSYDIIILGNFTSDTIVSASGTRHVDGGGFNYGAHAAAMMGLKVAAVTRLAQEDLRVVRALENIGVTVYPFFTSHSTQMRLEYPTANVDTRVLTVTATAGSFTPDQFNQLQAQAFLINASIRGEVPLEVIQVLREKGNFVVADAQGFVRVRSDTGRLVNAAWPEMSEYLVLIDVLKADAVEAESLTGENDLKKAAQILSEYGPKEIVLTHSDGMLVYADNEFYEARFLPEKMIGRSGRGDTCIGSYMAKRLSAPPELATIWSAAVTSLKMEQEGPIIRDVTEVKKFIKKKYKINK